MSAASRAWFITGASRGLGRALAEHALEQGDRVVGAFRDDAEAEAFAALAPGTAFGVQLDLGRPETIPAAVEEAIALVAGLDVVVNNGGIGVLGALEELEDEQIRLQMEVNFFGLVAVTRAVIPHLRRRGRGHLIQIGSVAGQVGSPGLSLYAAAKFAVEGLSEALAAELAPFGVQVTIVEPGALRTDWTDSLVVAEAMAEYGSSAGATRARIAAGDRHGDPRLTATAIAAIALREGAPLRLPLGSESLVLIAGRLSSQVEELNRWRSLTEQADGDPAA